MRGNEQPTERRPVGSTAWKSVMSSETFPWVLEANGHISYIWRISLQHTSVSCPWQGGFPFLFLLPVHRIPHGSAQSEKHRPREVGGRFLLLHPQVSTGFRSIHEVRAQPSATLPIHSLCFLNLHSHQDVLAAVDLCRACDTHGEAQREKLSRGQANLEGKKATRREN